jgi:hypothetical protein
MKCSAIVAFFSGSRWIGFQVGVPLSLAVGYDGVMCRLFLALFDCAEVELCFWMVDTH